jgi:hypothetical protein
MDNTHRAHRKMRLGKVPQRQYKPMLHIGKIQSNKTTKYQILAFCEFVKFGISAVKQRLKVKRELVFLFSFA